MTGIGRPGAMAVLLLNRRLRDCGYRLELDRGIQGWRYRVVRPTGFEVSSGVAHQLGTFIWLLRAELKAWS